MADENSSGGDGIPDEGMGGRVARGALQVVGGAVPYIGGIFSAVAGAWSEHEQAKVNRFFEHWVAMLEEEIREKEATIIEIMARLDLHDERISARVESREYQSLVRKTFREWAGAESEDKRILIRNLLSNAAASAISSDDVIRMFVDWIRQYSELHFRVIGAIYNSNGISRGAVWKKIGKGRVREDSADADLYKLLFRDLSVGGVVRQHREVDYHGNFVAKPAGRKTAGNSSNVLKSAFDEVEEYELTELGRQFVHYAMTELSPRIAYKFNSEEDSSSSE
ncbi:hypothetical protein G4D37_13010 [Burkholderia pseudomallei]|uniref:hypothetical protein n=1 Tax=Burkholderia pseudomallei TaxID=28450 RepID=UPI001594E560|nr:hypothetical protein [Burkholderia pseudomallei]MBF3497981.1 hypothetical protein [Burkholderia pseudomallei]NVH67158.1 hypothetical protein [Burkholderia pseudomallei]